MNRFHFTIKQKLQILDLVREEQWMQLATQFPQVTQCQIDNWSTKEQQMRALSETEQASKFTLHPGPEIKYKELYQFLYQTFKDLRSENKAVTGDLLLSLAEAEEPRLRELSFKGRHSLIQRWMEFYNLSIREITGHSGSQEEAISEERKTSISNFQQKYRQIIRDKRIPAENVFNMDQTSCYYENPSSRTIEVKGTREVCAKTQGNERKRVTLFSLINARGQLFSQLVVFKGIPGARVQAEVEAYDDLLTFHTVQKNSWTDGLVLIDWLYKIWRPICEYTEGPKLLLLDSYPLHKEFEKKFSVFDAQVLFIPPGLTWALQPLDAGYHNILKDQLRKVWTRNQGNELQNEREKRRALSTTLKTTFEYLAERVDHSIFWRKAGLEYPVVDFENDNIEASEDLMEVVEGEDVGFIVEADSGLKDDVKSENHLGDLIENEGNESGRDSRESDYQELMMVSNDFVESDQDWRNESTLMEIE
jgi:hypothetical protein